MLLSKGFNEESISIIFGEYGNGPRYPKAVPNDGIYLRYEDVANLGARYQRSIPHMLKKDIIKDARH